jgi:hypothetical protein
MLIGCNGQFMRGDNKQTTNGKRVRTLLETPVNMLLTRFLPSALVFSGVMLAQGTINTYAGNDALFAGTGQPATAAQLVGPNNVAVDGQGNVYFSASGLAMVLKVATNGIISVVAGNGMNRTAGDGGLAIAASLGFPAGLAFDSSGNLFIADSSYSNGRRVDPNGIITTVAGGQGQSDFSEDGGLSMQALLSGPSALAVDKSGNLISWTPAIIVSGWSPRAG